MKKENEHQPTSTRALEEITRRHFLQNIATGIGGIALGSLIGCSFDNATNSNLVSASGNPLSLKSPHFLPKAKNIIYLHMAGAPSQLELFDYKPLLHK